MNDGTPVSTHCCPARLRISCFRCGFKHTNQVRGGEFFLPCGVVARPTRQHHKQTGNRRGRIRRPHFLQATAMVAGPRLISCIRFYAISSNATMICPLVIRSAPAVCLRHRPCRLAPTATSASPAARSEGILASDATTRRRARSSTFRQHRQRPLVPSRNHLWSRQHPLRLHSERCQCDALQFSSRDFHGLLRS